MFLVNFRFQTSQSRTETVASAIPHAEVISYEPVLNEDLESHDRDDVMVSAKSSLTTSNERQSTLLATLCAWLCMVLALFASSSIGPAFRYMMVHKVLPCLGAVWRSQTMIITLLPFALYERLSNTENKVDWLSKKPDLPYPVVVHLLLAGLSWSAGLILWIIGLRFISTYKAAVVATCHPILLVVYLRLSGNPVSVYEWIGVFTSFSGVIVSNFSNFLDMNHSNPATNTTDLDQNPIYLQLFGFSLCLLSAAGEVAVIINRIKTRKYVPLLQYTVGTTAVVLLTASFATIILEDTKIFDSSSLNFCVDHNCLFGWVSSYWRWKMLIFGLWVGAVCITGFNYAMSYIPPVIFSSLSLLDPTITAFLSWAFGLEGLPSVYSWIGGVIVIMGVMVITFGEKVRESEEQQQENSINYKDAGNSSSLLNNLDSDLNIELTAIERQSA